ncbi:hypothetical protein GCM10017783_09230 [Deinococcus piscis]|uniref:Uncharacterized protein n=1 Tax=Deinococcus piscis TaxID=394230 RepID=A0ABQ3K173_9DEIO|nr:hypothetical protein [Deinococcus piscis]GHF99368.1 hypothetical protein GCM10017783_09230 [Deinococcus piscis]
MSAGQPVSSGQGAPTGWRTAALAALGAQVLALFLVAGYVLSKDLPNPVSGWLDAGHHFLTGILTLWWALLLGRLTLGRGVAQGEYLDRVRQALTLTFPLLTSFRGVLWGITALALAGGTSQAHPVALTALMTIWGASIIASYMGFFWLLRWSDLGPAEGSSAKWQLADWLNLSAALALGMTVINVVPITGFSVSLSQADQLVYGLSGLLDVIATLLSLQAVRLTGPNDASG